MLKVLLVILMATPMSLLGGASKAKPPAKKDKTVYPRITVKPEYRANYAATCAISTMTVYGRGVRGTGILLKSGVIVTNKHVVDINNDGIISKSE